MTKKINRQIRSRKVDLVNDDGTMNQDIFLEDAIRRAEEKGEDLVEVSQKDGKSICKIFDYGKFKYNQEKKKKQKTQSNQVIKEIKISYNISDNDLKTKHRKAFQFFEKGYRVKYSMELRGRQCIQMDSAMEIFEANLEDFKEKANFSEISKKSNSISILLEPA